MKKGVTAEDRTKRLEREASDGWEVEQRLGFEREQETRELGDLRIGKKLRGRARKNLGRVEREEKEGGCKNLEGRESGKPRARIGSAWLKTK